MTVAARMGQTPEQILETKKALAAKRWEDAENGCMPEYIPTFPETPLDEVPKDMGEPDAEWCPLLCGKTRTPRTRQRRVYHHKQHSVSQF